MPTKICTKCNVAKDHSEFYATKSGSLRPYCKECGRQMCREYKAKNRDKVSDYNKQYKSENKEEISIYNHDYHKNHRQEIQERQTKSRRIRKATDPNFKTACDLRAKLHYYISRRDASIEDLIGCTWDIFEMLLLCLFDDQMTFGNYGEYWTIDHVNPCCNFDLTEKENQVICFHWSNLRPMIKIENNKKHGKTIDKEINRHKKLVDAFVESLPNNEQEYYTLLDEEMD